MAGPDQNQTERTDPAGSKPQRVVTTHRRSLAKTVSWRVTATIDTFIISFFVTGSFTWASSIAGLEVLTKMGLYYLHERAWARVQWGGL